MSTEDAPVCRVEAMDVGCSKVVEQLRAMGVPPSRDIHVHVDKYAKYEVVLLGPQPSGFDAVVLEAVYPHVSRAIENRIRMGLGFLAPVLTPLLLVQLPLRLHITASELEPSRSIGGLGAPVLVVAGSKDDHTTLAESLELFDGAK